jgi:hypothetical protein
MGLPRNGLGEADTEKSGTRRPSRSQGHHQRPGRLKEMQGSGYLGDVLVTAVRQRGLSDGKTAGPTWRGRHERARCR